MAISQGKTRKTPSGKLLKFFRSKKDYETGKSPANTQIAEKKLQTIRGMGGASKQRLLRINIANILDQKSGKFVKSKIKTVVDNPANRNFVRRNIITKGAVIETDAGKARVTSRPGQDGTVNAVLI